MSEQDSQQTPEEPSGQTQVPVGMPPTAAPGDAIALPPVTPPAGMPAGPYSYGALGADPVGGPPPATPYAAAFPAQPYYWGAPQPPPPPAAHKGWQVATITLAAVVALAAGIGIGHAAWSSKTTPVSTVAPSGGSSGSSGSSGSGGFSFGSGSSGSSAAAGPKDVSAIAEKVDPGLVDIDTSLGYQSEQAAGTGIVLTSTGEVLTNNHVIDGATTISATDIGNGKTYTASVVGYDRTRDVAVLQLHDASGLTTASIGNSSAAAVGQDVVGIGNAGGTGGTPSAAGGTITALNQSITASDEGDGSTEQLTGLIETNADIQAGDSGGSLVNSSAQVIGMDTAASAGFSFQGEGQSTGNQGYAIPINAAISIAKEIEGGTATSTIHIGATGFIGLQIDPSSSSGGSGGFGGFGGFGGGSQSTTQGAEVASVITGFPAQEAGIAEGDVITTFDNKSIKTSNDLTNDLEPYHPGDKVTLGWTDTSGQTHTATVVLSSGPPQ